MGMRVPYHPVLHSLRAARYRENPAVSTVLVWPTKHDFRRPFLLLSIEEGPRTLCVHFLSHNHLDPRPIRLSKKPVLKLFLEGQPLEALRCNGFGWQRSSSAWVPL